MIRAPGREPATTARNASCCRGYTFGRSVGRKSTTPSCTRSLTHWSDRIIITTRSGGPRHVPSDVRETVAIRCGSARRGGSSRAGAGASHVPLTAGAATLSAADAVGRSRGGNGTGRPNTGVRLSGTRTSPLAKLRGRRTGFRSSGLLPVRLRANSTSERSEGWLASGSRNAPEKFLSAWATGCPGASICAAVCQPLGAGLWSAGAPVGGLRWTRFRLRPIGRGAIPMG